MAAKRIGVSLVAAMLAGCGSPPGASPDGSLAPDGRRDDLPDAADAPAATHGLVTVHLRNGDAPIPDQLVVFVDSTQTQVMVTDAAGNASTDVQTGASVTWVRGQPPTYAGELVVAVLDTKPGDTITLGNSGGGVLAPIELSFTPLPARPDLTYIAQDACFFATGSADKVTFAKSPIPLRHLDAGCLGDPMAVSVYAHDQTGAVIGGFHATAPYAAGETVALGAFTPLQTHTTTVSNLGGATAGIIRTTLDGFQAFADETSPGVWIDQGPPNPARFSINTFEPTLQSGQQLVTAVDDGTVTSLAYDGSAQLLPWLGTSTFDPITRTIATAIVPGGTSGDTPDYAFAFVTFGHSPSFYNWEVYAPSADSVVLPLMPPDLDAVNPKPDDAALFVGAATFDVDAIDGYRATLASDELRAGDTSTRPGTRRQCRSPVGP